MDHRSAGDAARLRKPVDDSMNARIFNRALESSPVWHEKTSFLWFNLGWLPAKFPAAARNCRYLLQDFVDRATEDCENSLSLFRRRIELLTGSRGLEVISHLAKFPSRLAPF